MENKQAYETPRLAEYGSIADRTLNGSYGSDWNWRWKKKWKEKDECRPSRFSFFHSSCASS
jgi:hypothetical protein